MSRGTIGNTPCTYGGSSMNLGQESLAAVASSNSSGEYYNPYALREMRYGGCLPNTPMHILGPPPGTPSWEYDKYQYRPDGSINPDYKS